MRRRWPLLLLAVALCAGAWLRFDWIGQRLSHRRTEKAWHAVVQWEPTYATVRWPQDEYLFYVSPAVNSYRGRGFVTDYDRFEGVMVTPPLQSLFILGVFVLAGDVVRLWVPLAVQAIVATSAIALAFSLGRRLSSQAGGVGAALLAAIYPGYVYYSGYLLTESNYLVLLALTLLLLCRFAERPGLSRALAAATCLGVTNLQRPNALHLGVLIAASIVCWSRIGRRATLASVFLFVPYLVLVPWLLRNWVTYHEPILISSNVGLNLYIGNNRRLDPLRTPYCEDVIARREDVAEDLEQAFRGPDGRLTTTYYRYSQAYMDRIKEYVRSAPLHFVKNTAIKLAQEFYLPDETTSVSVPFLRPRWAFLSLHWLLLSGGILGFAMLLRFRRSPCLSMVSVSFAYFALTTATFIASRDGRYTLNLKLFLILFLGAGLDVAVRSMTCPGRSGGGTAVA